MIGLGTLSQLPNLRHYTSRRASSWDTTGGNRDWWVIQPGARATLLSTGKPGCVKHIWCTVGENDLYPRQAVIRMRWDGSPHWNVEAPLGDFFGLGHGRIKNFNSAPLQMSPHDGRGFNCWWPMPFDAAEIEVENQGDSKIHLYFYVDYEEYAAPQGEDVARFHAMWRREADTLGFKTPRLTPENYLEVWDGLLNPSEKDNYVILEAEGDGIYVGCNLNIDCFHRQANDWYGEGDDMIVIDGEPWPPRLHGTGTEDYFCTAFGPHQEFCAPYHGIHLHSGNEEWKWKGKNSMYRYHIEDPIRFRKSIRVSIEHGHANKLSNDYSSTAYWYQKLPSRLLPELLPVEARMPRPDEPEYR